MDIVSKKKRSEIMSLVKGKNTRPEMLVFSYLRRQGIYFQKHYRRAPGSPDVALPKKKKAVFIEGGFWHGWRYAEKSGKWTEFWRKKISENMRRDLRNRRMLRRAGWSVLRIWDHDLASAKAERTLRRLADFLRDTPGGPVKSAEKRVKYRQDYETKQTKNRESDRPLLRHRGHDSRLRERRFRSGRRDR